MKNITLLIISLFLISCAQNNEEYNQLKADKEYVESNVNMYSDVWNAVFSEKNIDLVTSENFHEDVTVVTSNGDVTGLENFKGYYANYLNGFSDGEFTIVHVFSQGDMLVKQWHFKGTHDGEFFGIPATNKKLDLIGTTIVKMKDGKVLQEQDFFDNYTFLSQLGLL
tara:strand:- start:17366 stop:17866 length:501 start_codon:yes stop_codon:yes gene_type:complete